MIEDVLCRGRVRNAIELCLYYIASSNNTDFIYSIEAILHQLLMDDDKAIELLSKWLVALIYGKDDSFSNSLAKELYDYLLSAYSLDAYNDEMFYFYNVSVLGNNNSY